jgi:hypothetical protein
MSFLVGCAEAVCAGRIMKEQKVSRLDDSSTNETAKVTVNQEYNYHHFLEKSTTNYITHRAFTTTTKDFTAEYISFGRFTGPARSTTSTLTG